MGGRRILVFVFAGIDTEFRIIYRHEILPKRQNSNVTSLSLFTNETQITTNHFRFHHNCASLSASTERIYFVYVHHNNINSEKNRNKLKSIEQSVFSSVRARGARLTLAIIVICLATESHRYREFKTRRRNDTFVNEHAA